MKDLTTSKDTLYLCARNLSTDIIQGNLVYDSPKYVYLKKCSEVNSYRMSMICTNVAVIRPQEAEPSLQLRKIVTRSQHLSKTDSSTACRERLLIILLSLNCSSNWVALVAFKQPVVLISVSLLLQETSRESVWMDSSLSRLPLTRKLASRGWGKSEDNSWYGCRISRRAQNYVSYQRLRNILAGEGFENAQPLW